MTPDLEHVVSQPSTVAASPGSTTVRHPPAGLAGDVLGTGSTTPVERAVGTASPAVVDGPLAGASVGVGRAVVGLPSAAGSVPGRSEREAADGSSSGTERITVGLNICFEGPGANELFGLVLSDLLEALPKRLRGLECVSVTTLARVSSAVPSRRHDVYAEPVAGGYAARCHDCNWRGRHVWVEKSSALLEAQAHNAPQEARP